MSEELLAKYLSDRESLSEAEFLSLIDLLSKDPELRKTVREELVFEEFLSQSMSYDRRNFGAQMAQRLRDLNPSSSAKPKTREVSFPLGRAPLIKLRTSRQYRKTQSKFGLVAIVSCLILLLGVFFFFSGSNSWRLPYPKAVAQVDSISGSVEILRGSKKHLIQAGEKLFISDVVQVHPDGNMAFVYPDLSKIELKPDTEILFQESSEVSDSGKVLFLKKGKLLAQISPQKRRIFRLITLRANIQVMGTHFALSEDSNQTQLAVKDGTVIFERASDSKVLNISAGEYAVIRENQLFENKRIAPIQQEKSFIDSGSVWKYLDNGTDPGVSWVTHGFDDSQWLQGAAPLGYGQFALKTKVQSGPEKRKFITTYFRKTFSVVELANMKILRFRFVRDDGVIVYLNGVEAFRSGMPAGEVNAMTRAFSGQKENIPFEEVISPQGLKMGENVVSVELHQSSDKSSDIQFDLELTAIEEIAPDFFK